MRRNNFYGSGPPTDEALCNVEYIDITPPGTLYRQTRTPSGTSWKLIRTGISPDLVTRNEFNQEVNARITGDQILQTEIDNLDLTLFPFVQKDAAYVITEDDYGVECTANTFGITIPQSVELPYKEYCITNSGNGTITVSAFSPINGLPSVDINPDGYLLIAFTGTYWRIINQSFVVIKDNGVIVNDRRILNFIPGTNITLNIADDALNKEIDIQIGTTTDTPKIKSGTITGASFAGLPRKSTVTFATPFSDANYSVTVIGEVGRAWSAETQLAGSFVINSNSNISPTGNVYWTATKHGEN